MKYQVVFTGRLKADVTGEEVRQALVDRFGFTPERADRLLEKKRAVLQKGLTSIRAEMVQGSLEKIGLLTDIESMVESKPEPALSPARTVDDVPSEFAPESAPLADDDVHAHPFRFTGRTGEYFKIWLVNILLTVLTLGIYSAWAKVRTNRYFYGHTRLDGHAFDYLAQPMSILKGRLVAVAVLLIYVLIVQFFPLAEPVLLLALFVVSPLIIVRALKFRYRNSSYRGLRFDFTGGYADALIAFVLLPIAGAFTLGLLLPFAIYQQKRFMVRHTQYGATEFGFQAAVSGFYKIALGVLLLFVAGMALSWSALIPVISELDSLAAVVQGGNATPPELDPATMGLLCLYGFLVFAVMALSYLLAYAYWSAKTANLIYDSSSLGFHGFHSVLSPWKLAWIYLSNAIVVLLTLGLARPWAAIRLARYRAATLTFFAMGALDRFVAGEQQTMGAAGEEFGDVFDMDIGL